MLQAIGVFSVSTVGRPPARLDVGRVPRLRADRPQKGRGVESPGANLKVKRLDDHTTAIGPEILKPPGERLKG